MVWWKLVLLPSLNSRIVHHLVPCTNGCRPCQTAVSDSKWWNSFFFGSRSSFFFFSIHCCISLSVVPSGLSSPVKTSHSSFVERKLKSGRVVCLWSRSPRIYFSISNKSAQIFSRRIHPEGGKHCRTCVRTGGGATNPHRFFSSFFLCARGIV